MPLVLAGIGVEDRDAPVDVPVGDEDFVGLRVVERLGWRSEVRFVVAAGALAEAADLQKELAVPIELQDLRVALAV